MFFKDNNSGSPFCRVAVRFLWFFLTVLASSCGNYLDVTPENVGTIDYAFRNRNEAEKYLFACYNTLQGLNTQINDPGFITSGEVYNNSYADNLAATNFLILSGTQNTNSPILNYWEGTAGGINLFQGIRRCNIMLENIQKPIDLSDTERERWISEVKFLKAYYHYILLKMYGPIPIMDNADDISESLEVYRKKRVHADIVFSYITNLLDESIPSLPVLISNTSQELGRITRSIALGVKAEVLALQASPLFNGNPDYSSFRDQQGEALFAETQDISKWRNAAKAAKEAIDHARAQGHELYDLIIPAAIPLEINDSLKRLLTLQQAITEKWDLNKEVIWALNGTVGYQENYIPRLASVRGNSHGNVGVPLAVAELYYTQNGVPLEEDNTFDYNQRYNLKIADRVDRFYIRENYTTVSANFNREPRYYASIGFDGGAWYGGGVLDPNAMLYVQARKGGNSGVLEYGRANLTGFWPKKLVNFLTSIDPNSGNVTINNYRMPRLRLSDLYLLYAECLNESEGPSTEVYDYIDRVRARAGLKGVVQSWTKYSSLPNKPQTKEGLRDIIHRERRVELMFEGKSGWDLRRWKEYVNEVSKPIQGWNVNQEEIRAYYTVQTYLIPALTNKDYFWPVSISELLRNNNLVQSPIWR
ncbi:RagB/SusD family nutrient uptake outer membrane protein [Sphingobacterium bambusae]|uniref:RagB/SusD family nutrient uptake outer membrane protein n=1 Tax=Sphingobacterium bambusae TaxID=662858 RepID=A0ABW6BGQ3_9SPHI|nr:RagB/SusD family nutrient uptake outer membrane protein [Sphingobacterium bambusae]WPL49491.1 RagB/SusD family nutrient uptake outer membrane protein [Sphingobacterium bambusae]